MPLLAMCYCNKYIFIALTAFAIIISSCSNNKSQLDLALDAALDNRSQLEQVLNHYKDDSLKYLAATYLIQNMPFRYGFDGEGIDKLHQFYQAASHSNLEPKAIADSMQAQGVNFSFSELTIKQDIRTIKSDFLIDHIDAAFDIWHSQPWGKQIDFKTFCENILPYRIGNERLQPWIRSLNKHFSPLLDSIKNTPDSANMVKACEVVLQQLQDLKRHYGHGLPTGVTIGPQNALWFAGDCREFTDILTYIMRSLGFPVGCDKMPMTANYFLPHFWNYLIDSQGNTLYGSILFKTSKFEPALNYTAPKGKVMREKFELNQDIDTKLKSITAVDSIYPTYRYFTDKDVTALYIGDSIKHVSIPFSKLFIKPHKDDIIYICFSSHLSWTPVYVAWQRSGVIDISDIEGDVIMCLAVYRNNQMTTISQPFKINKKNGKIRYYNPSDKYQSICLYYKFDDIFREKFSIGMLGGVFEGSNTPDFSLVDTLYQISRSPIRLYSKAKSKSNKAYKYLRYFGPQGGKCYVAEVTFYGHAPNSKTIQQINGECIGRANVVWKEDKYPFTNVFDNDPYTSMVSEVLYGGWTGLKLQAPMIVDSITYTPRNRRNFIEAGDEYQLYYYDRTWKSLGVQIARADSIIFSAPTNALLYLKNNSKGNQERIFEYTKGKQIFW